MCATKEWLQAVFLISKSVAKDQINKSKETRVAAYTCRYSCV